MIGPGGHHYRCGPHRRLLVYGSHHGCSHRKRILGNRMTAEVRRCVICGGAEQPGNLLSEDGVDGDALIHLHCYNSPAAREWRAQRCRVDPMYARSMRLMTLREPVACEHCGVALNLLPKAIGMGAGSWEVTCIQCPRPGPASLSAYGEAREYFAQLANVRHDFILGRNLDDVDRRVAELAMKADHLVNGLVCGSRCPCGGQFSIAAKPRCPHCGEVAFDSYFHLVDNPQSEERRARLRALGADV
jgi:hypothetical protein